ncbi:hypothetical protein C8R43DRAFT_941689 [Mycena crocata]|nr:hypothetical protein C8R43DRAFT_941689 [Mycena crocata]
MSGGAPRSLRNPGNPGQGTAFHELVVLPTFAPEHARPYTLPGTSTTIDPLVSTHTLQAAASAAPAITGAGADIENDVDPIDTVTQLFVHVTLEWTERQKSTRSNARSTKKHELKLVVTPVTGLSTTRVDFIPIALSAHGYDDLYVAGVASGPSMRVFWTGSPQGLKETRHCMHSPDPYKPELTYGTHVPHTDNYSPAQITLGAAIDEIKAAHSCTEHGTCFINADGQHIEMNRFRLGMWGQAVNAGKCTAASPPPKELLASWTGASSLSSTSKPRGHMGPHSAQQQGTTTSNSDTTTLLLTTMVPVMAMMAQNMASNHSTSHPVVAPAPPRSPMRASSPPPPIDDDLDVFMEAFCCAKKLLHELIDNTKLQLRNACYTPDVLCEPSVTFERLKELTGLAEGEVHQLTKFARQWSSKMESKRARRGITY